MWGPSQCCMVLTTVVFCTACGSHARPVNTSSLSLSITTTNTLAQTPTLPWPKKSSTLPVPTTAAPMNVTPPFVPSLGDLSAEGATFVLGIVLGSIVGLFASVFCCCNHVLRDAADGHKPGGSSYAAEIELDAMEDGTGYLTPEPQLYPRGHV